MSAVSCGISPVTDIGPQCSGNGDCVPLSLTKGFCVCQDGWQGTSDFQVTDSALDCQINVVAIRILWALFLFFHMAVYYHYMTTKVKALWHKHLETVSRQKEVGKEYKIFHNKGLFAVLPYIIVGWLCQTIYAILRIAVPDWKLGQNWLVTILYIVWRITFYFACDTYQPALLASLLRSQKSLDHIIRLNTTLSRLHLFLTSAVSITAIIPLVLPPSDQFDTTVGMVSIAVFFNVTAVAMLFLGIQGAYIGSKVQHILSLSYELNKEPRTKRLMEKIAANQKQIRVTGFVQFLVYGLFGCFPYLWNKHDYMLPFAWCFVALTLKQAITALVQDGTSTTSSTPGTQTEGSGAGSLPSPQPPPPRRPAPPESTVVGTMDANSVYEVDENAPALLATAEKWANAKKVPL